MTDRRRDPPISYRPPEDLRAEFRARVETSGLSVNAFITRAIFESVPVRQGRRSSLDKQQFARLLGEATAIRQRLETLPAVDEPEAGLQAETLSVLRDVRTLLMQAMGRAP